MQLNIDIPNDAYKALQVEAKQRGETLDKLIVKYLSLARFISGNEKIQSENNNWPEHFFEETAGCFSDSPLSRAPQGEFEKRLEF